MRETEGGREGGRKERERKSRDMKRGREGRRKWGKRGKE